MDTGSKATNVESNMPTRSRSFSQLTGRYRGLSLETASRYKHCFEIVTAGVILTARADTEEQMHQWVKTVSDIAAKVDNMSRLELLQDGQRKETLDADYDDYDEDVDILEELVSSIFCVCFRIINCTSVLVVT